MIRVRENSPDAGLIQMTKKNPHVEHFVPPVIHMLHTFIALIDLHLRLVLLFHSNVSSLNVIQLLYFVFAAMFIQKRNNR